MEGFPTLSRLFVELLRNAGELFGPPTPPPHRHPSLAPHHLLAHLDRPARPQPRPLPSRARFDTTPRARLHRVTCLFTPRHVRPTPTALRLPYDYFSLATLPAYERNTTARTPLTLRVRFGNKRHSAGLIRLRVSLSSTAAGTRQSSTPTCTILLRQNRRVAAHSRGPGPPLFQVGKAFTTPGEPPIHSRHLLRMITPTPPSSPPAQLTLFDTSSSLTTTTYPSTREYDELPPHGSVSIPYPYTAT